MANKNGFSISVASKGSFAVLSTDGPLNEEAGVRISEEAEKLLSQGVTRLVFNLGHALTISSPTVAVFLDLSERIVDGKGGRVMFSGLTDLNLKVFEMVGIFLYADACPSVQEAEAQVML